MRFLLKLAFSAGLIYWLVHTDRLSFSVLRIFIDEPMTMVAFLLYWVMSNFLLCGFRWMILARTLGINLPVSAFLRLHMVGSFFNIVLPGIVGGDLVKAYYVADKEKGSSFTNSLASVLFDRVCGLTGIFFIATVSFFVRPNSTSPALDAVLITTRLLSLASIAGIVGLFYFGPKIELEKWPKMLAILERFHLAKLIRAVLIYSTKPKIVLTCVGFSMTIQLFTMIFFYAATLQFVSSVSFTQICIAYPLTALVSALPISPAGLGTGHMALEKLYDIVGLGPKVGANVFNLYFCGTVVLNCLGVIPYLMYKKSIGAAMSQASQNAAS